MDKLQENFPFEYHSAQLVCSNSLSDVYRESTSNKNKTNESVLKQQEYWDDEMNEWKKQAEFLSQMKWKK